CSPRKMAKDAIPFVRRKNALRQCLRPARFNRQGPKKRQNGGFQLGSQLHTPPLGIQSSIINRKLASKNLKCVKRNGTEMLLDFFGTIQKRHKYNGPQCWNRHPVLAARKESFVKTLRIFNRRTGLKRRDRGATHPTDTHQN